MAGNLAGWRTRPRISGFRRPKDYYTQKHDMTEITRSIVVNVGEVVVDVGGRRRGGVANSDEREIGGKMGEDNDNEGQVLLQYFCHASVVTYVEIGTDLVR